METEKRLLRSRSDKVIAGIAGGLGKYFNIDPLIIRILFVILALFGAGGVIVYLILWIAIPEDYTDSFYKYTNSNNKNMENKNETKKENYKPYRDYEKRKNDGNLIAGLILITLGVIFLIDRFVPRVDFGDLWPLLLIIAGIFILRTNFSKPKNKEK